MGGRIAEWPKTPRGQLARAALALVVIAGAVAITLLLQEILGVERLSTIYLAAVLLTAAWLGVWCGLLAAAGASIALRLYGAGHLDLSAPIPQDVIDLCVFATGAWVAGLYSDEIRRSRDVLLRATGPRMAAAGDLSDLRGRLAALESSALDEVVRATAAAFLSLASLGIGSLAASWAGAASVSMIYLTGVVLAATLLGARYALITGILNAVAYSLFNGVPHGPPELNTIAAAVNLIVYLAVGWQVGQFAERVRFERRAVRSLYDAGRSFSTTADEATLRRLLADAVAAVTGGRLVVVTDEEGAVAAQIGSATGDAPTFRAVAPGTTETRGSWRSRALWSESNPLGAVTWWTPQTKDDDRPVDAAIGVLVDLGAAAIGRSRLAGQQARLEAIADTEQLRRALLASVSHDLRSPLSGILASATSLIDHAEKFTPEVRLDLLLNIREQSFRLSRYVDNLLGMTRLEAGALRAEVRSLALEPIVFEAWESIVERTRGAQADLRISEAANVLADPELLRHVLANVLENAVRYSPEGATVEVTSRCEGSSVILTVRDQGPGAPDEELEMIFEPFARGKTAKTGGVGLGLFIARSFLEAMGAAIRALPARRGEGFALEITLVAAQA